MSGANMSLEHDGMERAISPTECPASVDDKALVRKIDRRVLPMLFVIYVAAFLDR